MFSLSKIMIIDRDQTTIEIDKNTEQKKNEEQTERHRHYNYRFDLYASLTAANNGIKYKNGKHRHVLNIKWGKHVNEKCEREYIKKKIEWKKI